MEVFIPEENVKKIILYWNSNQPIGQDKWSLDAMAHIDKIKGNKKALLRFLDKNIINFSSNQKNRCRLCCQQTIGRQIYWHTNCWHAVEPYTARYWKKIISRKRRLKASKSCAYCKSLCRGEADHILAICLGGKSTYENLQFLCKSCHKSKTASDLQKFRTEKKLSSEKEQNDTD